jgi:hypothetical protein
MNVIPEYSPRRAVEPESARRALPDERNPRSELTATAVLLMLPKHSRTPAVVITDRPVVPSSVELDVFDGRKCFLRLRRGANTHGLTESYREVSRDEFPPEFTPTEVVRFDRYVQARFTRSASLFGTPDAVVFAPRAPDGRPFDRVRIPIPSLDNRSWHDFTLNSQSRTECVYRIAEAAGAAPSSLATSGVAR